MISPKIIYLTFQIVAVIAAIWLWKNYKNSTQKFFLYYTVFVVVVEFFGILFKQTEYSNYFVYNIYILISFLFYFYWFSLVLPEKKNWIYGIMWFFLGINLLGLFYENPMVQLLSLPMYVGIVLLLFCVISLFSSLLMDTKEINFLQSQKFWIATGMLIFYLGYLPTQYLLKFGEDYKSDYRLILALLNSIYSLCLTISFYVARNNRV